MNRIVQPEAFRLLETGVGVPFRVVEEEVLPAPDESEFGMRVTLQLEDPEDPEGDAQDLIETIGRGNAPLRWIDRMKGKGGLRVVDS